MPSKSPTGEIAGHLFVVATPIGHPDDITLRALAVLDGVELIAAEDTRLTARLLARHEIATPLISYHEHNEQRRTPQLIARMRAGERIALVSDAGTPLISDPGYRLIRQAAEEGLQVVPIPGVSAAVAALSVAGLPTDAFVFAGFLPRRPQRRRTAIAALARETRTVIFYESPQRIAALLQELSRQLGPRPALLAREMTKPYEELLRGTLTDLSQQLARRAAVKGECTLVVGGAGPEPAADTAAVLEQVRERVAAGDRPTAIARLLAGQTGVARNWIYDAAVRLKQGRPPPADPDAAEPTPGPGGDPPQPDKRHCSGR